MKIKVMHRTFKKALKSGEIKTYKRIQPDVNITLREYKRLFSLLKDYFDKNGCLNLELESASGDKVIFRCLKPGE